MAASEKLTDGFRDSETIEFKRLRDYRDSKTRFYRDSETTEAQRYTTEIQILQRLRDRQETQRLQWLIDSEIDYRRSETTETQRLKGYMG